MTNIPPIGETLIEELEELKIDAVLAVDKISSAKIFAWNEATERCIEIIRTHESKQAAALVDASEMLVVDETKLYDIACKVISLVVSHESNRPLTTTIMQALRPYLRQPKEVDIKSAELAMRKAWDYCMNGERKNDDAFRAMAKACAELWRLKYVV
jgi:hypothetical protein